MTEGKREKKENPWSSLDHVLASRTVVISGSVKAELAEKVMQILVLLEERDATKPITIFVNSPGGDLHSGFAIFDMIRFSRAPVHTIAVGLVASMGSIIALAPPAERRFSLPNAKFLIHQPLLMGYQGKAIDLEIQAREILRERERVVKVYQEGTGGNPEAIARDIERDYWMTAEEALSYGLISKILASRDDYPGQAPRKNPDPALP